MIFSARSFLQCTGKEPRSGSGSGWSQCPLALPSENESRVTPSLLSKKTPTAHPQRGRGCQTPALSQGPAPSEGPSEAGHGTARAPTSAVPFGWSSGHPGNSQQYKSPTAGDRLTRDCQSFFRTQQGQSKQNRMENRISAPSPHPFF